MADLVDRLRAALADRYLIERELGRGGMAIVYLAEDRKHQRRVALKVLRPELAASLGAERFLREIQIAAQLTHPNILPLFDSGRVGGAAGERFGDATEPSAAQPLNRSTPEFLYYTMPYIQGESLRDRLNREKQIPIADALQITQEVAEALGYAHEQGIIHRDIKPENILFQGGHALVADFGIARAVSAAGAETLTETGLAVGTPAYMSPEQGAGSGELDARSDLYSLGCVLYEMLSGETPYTGRTPQAILAKKLTDPLPPVSTVRETVPAAVEATLAQVLARNPVDRFATAQQLADALAGSAVPVARVASSSRPYGERARWWLGASAAVAVVAIIVAVLRPERHTPSADLDRNLIAVMPFRSASTDTALSDLGSNLVTLFWMKLTGDEGPRAADPGVTLAAAGEVGLTEDQALMLAQRIGAGRLIQGAVAGTASRVELTAVLSEVPSGRLRADYSVVGHADSLTALADALIVGLLAQELGEEAERLPMLTRYEPTAVRSYLLARQAMRQFDWPGACRRAWQAIRADSTFALAAMLCYQAGEDDTAAARLAWEHRATLSARDQRFLHALAGATLERDFDHAQEIAEFDTLVALYPDWPAALGEWANALLVFGPNAGVSDWALRVREGLERMLDLGSRDALVELSLVRVASHLNDTAAVLRSADLVSEGDAPPYFKDLVRWHRARFLGDSAETARIRATMHNAEEFTLGYIASTASIDGRDPEDAELAVAAMLARDGERDPMGLVRPPEYIAALYSHARGRHREWLTDRQRYYRALPELEAATWMVRDALYLGASDDTAVAEAVRLLEEAVDGARSHPPDDSQLAAAHCWLAQWQLHSGGLEGVDEALRYLRERTPTPRRFAVCAALIEYLRADLGGQNAYPAALRLDSVSRSVPWGLYDGGLEPTMGLAEVILSRAFAQYGEPAQALRAARRRTYTAFQGWWVWADQLREEARLAVMVGDTAGAIGVYDHYLMLRSERPEHPAWAAQWDSVRAELAALVAR